VESAKKEANVMWSVATPMLAVSMLVVAGCGATIRTSITTNTELGEYKTYAFCTPSYRQGKLEDPSDRAIKSALKHDLAAKGFTEAASGRPDFLISYHFLVASYVKEQPLAAHAVRYGFSGWPGTNHLTEYTRGTLIVEFINPQSKQVFWRATGSQLLKRPESPNTAKTLRVVGQIVNRYSAQVAAARTTM
jgi:hypothetical protein